MRESADLIFDTSETNVHQLTNRVAEAFANNSKALKINVLSFGFKYGLPVDADLVADARFIANPHWKDELRAKTGNDDEVRAYVLGQRRRGLPDKLRSIPAQRSCRLPKRKQEIRNHRDWMYWRQAPFGGLG